MKKQINRKTMTGACNCKNIMSFGSQEVYAQQVRVDVPDTINIYNFDGERQDHLYIDPCLAKEVEYLWSLGITTTGCCCGHNLLQGYIGVIDDDIPRMKALGYVVAFNPSRPNDEDSFIPKYL